MVVLALVGGAVQAMLHGLAALRLAERPVVVTGYVGVVYEKLADGLLLRHGADVVLANSRHDADRFRAVYEGVGADASARHRGRAALPRRRALRARGRPRHRRLRRPALRARVPRRPHAICCAGSSSTPGCTRDREVLLKLRSKPGEHTTHIEELPYQKLAERLPGGLPPNFRLVYGHMGEVLDRTDLLVTVSSTAALESLHRRHPHRGPHRPRACARRSATTTSSAPGCWPPGTSWTAATVRSPTRSGWRGRASPPTARTTRPSTRPASASPNSSSGRELAPIAPYYTPATAPGYLPGILARHHLAPDGTPLPGAAPKSQTSALRRVVREAVRNAARGAYRHGVQRVAPVIRRMGEL